MQKARGRTLCDECAQKVEAELAAAVTAVEPVMTSIIQSHGRDAPAIQSLRNLERTIATAGGDVGARKAQFLRAYLDYTLADERLTPDEEAQVGAVVDALYPADQQTQGVAVLREYAAMFYSAMVNDGRLPVLDSTDLVLRRGEQLHLQVEAAMLKEVIEREWQAGSRGMSFRVMKGVSYRVGATRGKIVEVGRSLEEIDRGTLFVTSKRVVYTGDRKSMEVPYTRLLDINVYSDAIVLHVSNRQNPSMLRVPDGQIVAVAVTAAMQRVL